MYSSAALALFHCGRPELEPVVEKYAHKCLRVFLGDVQIYLCISLQSQHPFLDEIFGLDLTHDGNILVSADVAGRLFATSMVSRHQLWHKKMKDMVLTLRILRDVVVVPDTERPVLVLNVTTGDLLHEFPALKGRAAGLCLFLG